ncbi:hypothetical protein JZ751_025744 [Albula glossodonta]|uniref:Uncharacterized protein n=1 Tax=Albula glossodonta TaxID=121402 RepID=A0A8T2NE06_9TELE|nr:hypothetical protein JZ751_025744 [Albula glossodonta]
MRDWIISKAWSIPRQRFQMEPIQTDGLIHLAWEVKMRLKLQNICRDLGLSLSSPPALSDLETQRATLSDLYAPPMRFICLAAAVFLACPPAVTAPVRFFRFYFDPQPVVERAVREIIEELAQPPTSRLHIVAEVVMDTVADLSCSLLEGGEELSGRLLSDMAVAVTVSVLQELEGVKQCEVQRWRQVRPRLVGALCGELLETVSPKALQRALRGKWDAESRTVTAAIITSVTAAVNSVLAQPDATPGSSLETAVDADEEAKEVETMLVDVAAPSIQMETAADAAAEAEQVETVLVDVATPSIQMETAADAAAEAEQVETVLMETAADAAAEAEAEEVEIVLLRTCSLLPSLCIDILDGISSKAKGPHIASPFPGSSTFRPCLVQGRGSVLGKKTQEMPAE